jgi:hypothetical protein
MVPMTPFATGMVESESFGNRQRLTARTDTLRITPEPESRCGRQGKFSFTRKGTFAPAPFAYVLVLQRKSYFLCAHHRINDLVDLRDVIPTRDRLFISDK